METWFTSDHHFGHANIIKFCDRGFHHDYYPYDPDVEAMNEALIEAWNDTVSPGDQVFYLGDFAMGKIEEMLKIVARLNGTIHLLPGNHDRCWMHHKKGVAKWRMKYKEAGFATVMGINRFHYEGFDVCHFPFSHTEYDERYADHRPQRRGYPLIHGHVHDAWKINEDQINVGVDVWGFKPVNFDTIREEML